MATIIAAVGGGNWTAGATWIGGVAPTAADDAVLHLASGNVTIDTGSVARSLDCTSGVGSYTGTLTHTAGVTLTLGDATAGAGNVALKLTAGMTYSRGSSTSVFAFVSTSATQQTVTHAGKGFGGETYNGAGGSWKWLDTVTMIGTFILRQGTFDGNSLSPTVNRFICDNNQTRTFSPGTATWSTTITTASNFWNVSGVTGLTWNGANLTITVTGTSTQARTISLTGQTVKAVNYIITNTGALIFDTTGTIGTLSVANSTGTRTLTMTGQTITITDVNGFNVNGSVSGNISITGGTLVSANPVSVDRVTLLNQTGSGAGVPFYAGANSTDSGGNTNWAFTPPVTLRNRMLTGVGL